MSIRNIQVYVELDEDLFHVGQLWARSSRIKEGASFQYEKSWLSNKEKFALEPALELFDGQYHTPANRNMFGAIGDSAPDRWGRVLMRRNASRQARLLNKPTPTLTEIDYLLGVCDEARQGALRFSETIGGPFLQHINAAPIPPLIDLPRLLSASEKVIEDKESDEDLRLLLAPGSSLGGARPKASVRDTDGQLCIAKFPHRDDEFSNVLWEAIALKIASEAGISVPKFRIEFIASKPTLIINRFDRNIKKRIPFLSSMSMIGALDNESHSYLELVDAIRQHGAYPDRDMKELWKRIVFNILISNTDDHLRNHGFLYERYKGWTLSPLYDVNPTPIEMKPRFLSTAIDLYNTSASLTLALSVAKEYGIEQGLAKKIAKEVAEAVKNWKMHAKSYKISSAEIERMSSAFEHEDFSQAINF